MPKAIKGIRCKKGLPIRSVLTEWQKWNSRIASKWLNKDVPWWYNERASLSVFVGAIWNSGHFAFEEFSDEKRSISQRTRKFHKTYSGRVDLYFNVGKRDFIAEAKICWPRCSRLSASRQAIVEDHLAYACRDIRKSNPHGQRRLGILFVAPRWKTSLRQDIDQRIDAWVAKIVDIDCDAISWVFPAKTRTLKAYGYFYPGAAVLIREVRR